jgi:ABC-type transport system substrate-binding protein
MRTSEQKTETASVPGSVVDRRMVAYLHAVCSRASSRRRLLGQAAAVAMVAAASQCPRMAWARPRMQETTTFNYGLEGDVVGLEPALAYDTATLAVVSQLSEGLLMFDRKGSLQPLLAEHWEQEQPDTLTYVYHLRDDVTFHDGTTMTSADVLASIGRVRDPATASPVAWMYDAVDTVEAADDHTVTITLTPECPLPLCPCRLGRLRRLQGRHRHLRRRSDAPPGGDRTVPVRAVGRR